MQRPLLGFFVIAAAYRSTEAPAVREPAVLETSEPARKGPPPASEGPCDERAGVFVTAPDLSVSCADGHLRCDGTTTLTVHNCSAHPVELLSLRRRQGDATVIYTPADAVLPPGSVWSREDRHSRAGRYAVSAALRHNGTQTRTPEVMLTVDNPDLDAAMAACQACDGDWGAHGLASHVGCNCQTTDAGNECRDGRSCEGACLFDHYEVVRPATDTCRPDGSCTVHPALGVPVGRCSSWQMNFGCRAWVRRGAADEAPVVLPRRAPLVCVD